MSRLKLSPQMQRNFMRILNDSPGGDLAISAPSMRRLEKMLRTMLADLIWPQVVGIQIDDKGRWVICALDKYDLTERIVYDPKTDRWESDGSAGRGCAGLIARVWNRQDNGRVGSKDILNTVAGSFGQAVLLDLEKQSGDSTTYSSNEETDPK